MNAFDDTSSLVTSISDWLIHIHSTTCTLININLLLYGEKNKTAVLNLYPNPTGPTGQSIRLSTAIART